MVLADSFKKSESLVKQTDNHKKKKLIDSSSDDENDTDEENKKTVQMFENKINLDPKKANQVYLLFKIYINLYINFVLSFN